MAKQGLMKKYIQMAKRAGATSKTLFKKAWALQKRKAKGPGRKSSRPNPHTATKGVKKMATKIKTKTVIKYRNKKNPAKPKKRQRLTFMRNKLFNAGVNGAVIGGSAIASTALVNMVPVPKGWDVKNWQKALAQFAAGGLGWFFFRNLWAKKFFTGTMAGGAITWLLPWLKEQAIVPWMGNNRSKLTPYQISKLRMGDYSARNGKYAGPVDVMSGPVDVMAGNDFLHGEDFLHGNNMNKRYQSVSGF